jgi:methionine synthase II (cobalamin-independent)
MGKRLEKVVREFGVERVPYAGPECGLWSFPSYQLAIDSLEKVAKVITHLK